MSMLYLLTTILIFLQAALLTSKACPTSNGNTDSCETCDVYDYVMNQLSSTTMFLNINISRYDVINDIKAFKGPVLSKATPKYYGMEERLPETNPPCYFDVGNSGTLRTGCGQEIVVNGTEDGSLLCPWKYDCDYDKNRIPQYLWRARCLNSTEYSSRQISYRVPVLKLDNFCNPFLTGMSWRLQVIEVPVACVCVNSQQ